MCVECMLYGVHGMYVNMVENGQRQETCTNDRDDFFFHFVVVIVVVNSADSIVSENFK